MKINPTIKKIVDREKQNHYIVNIMMVALFSLVLLLSLFGGVKVDVGSITKDDGNELVVRQSFFQVFDTAILTFKSRGAAEDYVEKINKKLESEYGVMGLGLVVSPEGSGSIEDPPFHNLDDFDLLIKDFEQRGGDVNSINWLKYRFAYAKAILIEDASTLSQWQHLWKSNWNGHMAYAQAGQAIVVMFATLALMVISLIMLIFAIIALIKKKPYTKGRFSLLLLMICMFFRFIFCFGLMKPDWTFVLSAILIFMVAIAYSVMQHLLMKPKDFSKTMFIRNCVLLGGSVLAFILMMSPWLSATNASGNKIFYNWSYLYDVVLAEGAYMLVPMSYVLVSIISIIIFMLPIVLNIIVILTLAARFLAADYQYSNKRIQLAITLAFSAFIMMILASISGGGGLNQNSLYLQVSLVAPVMIMQLLVLAGMTVFEFIYKTIPIKKEIVIKQ